MHPKRYLGKNCNVFGTLSKERLVELSTWGGGRRGGGGGGVGGGVHGNLPLDKQRRRCD